MRFICVAFILLLVLMTSAQCQQTAEDWFNKGIALLGQGKYDEGIKAYDEAIRLDPSYVRAWNNKGLALFGQGNYDEAIKAFDEAIKLDPKFAMAWNNKGLALFGQGKYDEAIKALDEAIRLDPHLCLSLDRQRQCSQVAWSQFRSRCRLRQGQGTGV
jgi:tetratricopeptide (TPR) repeat protein